MNLIKRGWFVACVLLLTLASCNDPDLIGLDLQPENQLGLTRTDTFTVLTTMVPEDSLISSRLDQPLFAGSYNEPALYGSTYGGFAMQIRLGNTVTSTTFNNASTVDSVVLSFAYRSITGDTMSTHHLTVHELGDALYSDSVYYSNHTYNTAGILGHRDFRPSTFDSVNIDNVMKSPQLRVPLDTAFGGRLLREYQANPGTFASSSALQAYLKGFVIVDSADGTGSMMTLEPVSNFNRLTLYFGGTGVYEFIFDNNTARYSWFRHNYTTAVTDTLPDQQAVVESMAGIKTKIKIPFLKNLLNGDRNVSLNSAQLIFTVAPGTVEPRFTPHSNLLVFGVDSAGHSILTPDATESAVYFGGAYESSYNRYKFNIARQSQRILNGDITDYGLYLVAGGSTSNAQRTVLNGGSNVKLVVTYTLVTP